MSPDPVFDILTSGLDKLTEAEPPALAPGYDHPVDQRSQEDALVVQSIDPGFFVHSAGANDYQPGDLPDPLFQGFQLLFKPVVDHSQLEVVFEPSRVQDQHFVLGRGEAGQGVEDVGEPEPVLRAASRL